MNGDWAMLNAKQLLDVSTGILLEVEAFFHDGTMSKEQAAGTFDAVRRYNDYVEYGIGNIDDLISYYSSMEG